MEVRKSGTSEHESKKAFRIPWQQFHSEFIDSVRARGYFLASENLVPGVNECRVGILYPFVAPGIFCYMRCLYDFRTKPRKEFVMPRMSKRNKREWGAVYQSQDRQEELQRYVSQVFAPMQAELSCNRDFLSKIHTKLGAKKHPGFARKRGK